MSSNVIALERMFRRKWDWSSPELAEFYRVESALIQAGLKIDTDRGVSDEGDPWFTFCRPDDGEVIVHIARIDGSYVLAGPSYEGIARGNDIRSLVSDLISRHPVVQAAGSGHRPGSNIFMHPAALLIAVVATAFFKSTEARALASDIPEPSKHGELRGGTVPSKAPALVSDGHACVVMDAAQSAIILAAIISVLQDSGASLSEHEPKPPGDHTSTVFAPNTVEASVFPDAIVPSLTSASLDSASAAQHDGNPTAAQTDAAAALPLIVVLWDLPQPTKLAGPDLPSLSEAAPAASADPSGFQAALLHVTLAAPTEETNDGLPLLQAVKISYSGGQGDGSHLGSQAEQVPQVLSALLQGASHLSIGGEPQGLTPSESIAESLVLPSAHSPVPPVADTLQPTDFAITPTTAGTAGHTTASGTDPVTATTASTAAIPNGADPNAATTPTGAGPATAATGSVPANTADSSLAPLSSASTVHTATVSTAQGAAPASLGLPNNLGDVQAVIDAFYSHTADAVMVDINKTIIVYDAGAMASHFSDLQSVTFNFSDGSTLSLVGLPAALPHSQIV
jgi:hypothetical protein